MTEVKETKPTKYEQLLKLGKDALDSLKIPFEVRKAEKDLEKEIINIEQEVAELELKIQEAKSTRPLKLEAILDAIDKKELKQRELKLALDLQKELF